MNYYVKGKNITLHGYENISIEGTGNTIIGKDCGKHIITFSDGAKFKITYCDFQLGGIIFGKMHSNYIGNLIIEDLTNLNTCVIDMSPVEKSSGFLNSVFGSKKKNFPDYFTGYILPTSEVKIDKKKIKPVDESILARCEGEFSLYINWDQKPYWALDEEKFSLEKSEKMSFTLPSDSCWREDILFYKKGKIEFAQQAKMTIEERQRKDAKQREKFKKK